MQDSTQIEKNKIWSIPRFDLELHHARYVTHSFPLHTHEQYAIGVIERGALGFSYRGENVVAAAGDINLCIPAEAHTGQAAADEGWIYRMFYFDPLVLSTIASEVAERPQNTPFFRSGVIHDPSLAQQIRHLHLKLEMDNTPLIEQESALISVVANLIRRHADDPPPKRRLGQESSAVVQIKQYLEQNYVEDITLDSLSRIANLSRYYLVRVFRETVGVPPHAYLRQVRIQRAKELLASGQPIAEVAAITGFTDQSHLTRWFKRFWGFTPGQYRNSVQDNSRPT